MAAAIEREITTCTCIVNPDRMIKNTRGNGGEDKFKEGEDHTRILLLEATAARLIRRHQ